MNRFEDDFRHAARSKRNTVAIFSLVIMVFGLVLSVYLLSFRSLSITIKPETADQIAVIDVTKGVAFALANHIYALSDTVELSLSAAKYQTADLVIDNTNFGTDIAVVLLPKPGTLRATCNVGDGY